jgi:hypothetical protein
MLRGCRHQTNTHLSTSLVQARGPALVRGRCGAKDPTLQLVSLQVRGRAPGPAPSEGLCKCLSDTNTNHPDDATPGLLAGIPAPLGASVHRYVRLHGYYERHTHTRTKLRDSDFQWYNSVLVKGKAKASSPRVACASLNHPRKAGDGSVVREAVEAVVEREQTDTRLQLPVLNEGTKVKVCASV